MKKIIILIVLSCFIISGCGGKQDPAKSAKDGAKNVEIVMWLIGSEAQALTIKDLAKDFYKMTGIKVNCDALSWGDAHSKYLTSIAGGVAPDIGTMGLTWGAEFGGFGSMVDLKKTYPEEIKAIKEVVFPGLWNSIECQGKIFGIPFDMTEYVMYYRKDIIQKAPQTWGELTDLLMKLKEKNKGMIFDWGSMSWIGYSPFLWQAGGDYYNADYSQVTVNSPEAVLAMRFFSELYSRYNVPKTKIPLEQGMRTGDFPIAISGNWNIDGLRLSAPEIAGKWSIATLPKGPSGKMTAFIGGRIIGIFEQSKHKKEAWEFIKYLFTTECQTKLYEAALTKQDTYLPPSITTWEALNMSPEFKKVLVAQANDAKGPPAVANWDAQTKYVDEAIQKVILLGADPKKELEIAKDKLTKYRK